MKTSRNQRNRQSKAPAIDNNRPRPENKDDIDSRGNLEISNQPSGHNRKDVHSEGKKKKD